MTIRYVDPDAGGLADGTSWTNAYTSLVTAVGASAAGDILYYSASTAVDTYAAAQTLAGGTIGNPISVIGIKDGTTNEPPVESDLAILGTDTLPLFQITGAGNDLNLQLYLFMFGVKLQLVDQLVFNADGFFDFVGSHLDIAGAIRTVADPDRHIRLKNCTLEPGGTGFYIDCRNGSFFEWIGGSLITSAVTNLFDFSPGARYKIQGVDLSVASGNLIDSASIGPADFHFANCLMAAGWSLFNSAPANRGAIATAVACSSSTGKTSGQSFVDFVQETYEGTVQSETTAVRTGGANDGATGAFSWALTPNVDSTLEGVVSLCSPELTTWLAGDGVTSFTLTVYIANSGAADYNQDDVWMEVYTPDAAAGSPQHDQDISTYITAISGSTTVITDDATSTWGTGGNNPQKLSVTVTPDFEGVACVRVHFGKRFAATPETLYIDPKIEVV